MPLKTVIHEKRKEIGLTQEQVADYLGVSTPAVNKWEKGVTFPDISLLPALARLLKVDLNTLLDFNENLTEQEIGYFSNEVADTIQKIGFEAGFDLAMDKIREYPNCDILLHTMTMLLDGSLRMYGSKIKKKEFYKQQIIVLYERVAKSDNEDVRNKAVYMLASTYMGDMNYDKAQEMLDLLPERSAMDKKQIQASLLIKQEKYNEAGEILERRLLTELNEIQGILLSKVQVELKESNSKNASYLAEISQKLVGLFELWNYGSFVAPLEVAIDQKDTETSVSILKSILSSVLIPWNMKSSSIYHHMPVKESNKNFGLQLLPALISEMKNNPAYEFLDCNEEYQQIINKYQEMCKD